MRKFKPVHGILFFALFMVLVLGADYVLGGGLQRARYERVGPDAEGRVQISLEDLESQQIRFYRFLNPGNQEVRFFVGKDSTGDVQVAFDANEVCYKRKAGYRAEGDWVTCNKCDRSFRLTEVNAGGGGCKPVPFSFVQQGQDLILEEAEILKGWRYFR